jgi:hypothetical protein
VLVVDLLGAFVQFFRGIRKRPVGDGGADSHRSPP